MDVGDAVKLYRTVLRTFSEQFDLRSVLLQVASSLGGDRALLFLKDDANVFHLSVWGGFDAVGAEVSASRLGLLTPSAELLPKKCTVLDPYACEALGLGQLARSPGDRVVLLPVPQFGEARALLLVPIAAQSVAPHPNSFLISAISVIMDRAVGLLTHEMPVTGPADESAQPRLQEIAGELAQQLDSLADSLLVSDLGHRAAAFSLELLVKLLDLDGGSIHIWDGASGQDGLVAARGWTGLPGLLEVLFENGLPQYLLDKGPGEFAFMDARSVSDAFPVVEPYLYANNVNSFLLAPLFAGALLKGVIALFGRAYTVFEPEDMELMEVLCGRLASVLETDANAEAGSTPAPAARPTAAPPDPIPSIPEEGFECGLLEILVKQEAAAGAWMFLEEQEGQPSLYICTPATGARWVWGGALTEPLRLLSEPLLLDGGAELSKELPTVEGVEPGYTLLLPVNGARGRIALIGLLYRAAPAPRDRFETLPALGLMLENRLLRASLERYQAGLRKLVEFSDELSSISDAQRAKRVVTQTAIELLGCRRATLLLVSNDRLESVTEGERRVAGSPLSLAGAAEKAIQALAVCFATVTGEGTVEVVEGAAVGTVLLAPLVGMGAYQGALIFELPNAGSFAARDAELARMLAATAAARLKELETPSAGVVESKLAERIYGSLHGVSGFEDLSAVLHCELRQELAADLSVLVLLGEESRLVSGWHRGEPLPEGALAAFLERDWSSVTAPLQRDNLSAHAATPEEEDLARLGVRSYLLLPLEMSTVPGYWLIGASTPYVMEEQEPESFMQVARLAGLVLSSAVDREETELRNLELSAFLEELEERDRVKTDLLNMASHEVRHPLQLLMGFSEVLVDFYPTMDGPEMLRVVRKIGKSAERLKRRVSNLLELSRIESRRIELRREAVQVESLLRDIGEELEQENPGHRIFLNFPLGFPAIDADPEKLEIVLFNLVENSIKYSPPGAAVEVKGRAEGDRVIIQVIDEGVGIAEEERQAIFQPFKRGEERLQTRGMGLGLYIVDSFVKAHGGEISVDGRPGKGSIFTLRLPSATA
ncbi:MAG: sensor histidine kinase [Candidatus Geothermincolia bacterium]